MKTLNIIIPVYNEEKTIEDIIKKVQSINLNFDIKKELIIVNDGSSDSSDKILKKIVRGYNNIIYIKHQRNKGKGAAIRTALANCNGNIILIQDSDLEYNPEDYNNLLKPIMENKASVVYGSRFINTKLKLFGKDKTLHISHYFGNKFLTFVTGLFYNKKITDMETGYKVFKSNIIKNIKLEANRFEIEPEITSKILKSKHSIYGIPISFNPRKFEEGKKISWKDGIKALYYLLKYRIKN